MECKLTPRDFDQQIQVQLDVVTKILSASAENQDTAEAAMIALEQMRSNIERSLNLLTRDVRAKIDSSAEATATEAAKLLQQKFVTANQQAVSAAERYERAGHWLGVKIFMTLLLVLGGILGVAWLMITQILPTPGEIEARRAELANMELRATDLERRGARMEWGYCGASGKLLCFRTDESKLTWRSDDKTKTYAVPFMRNR